jgi:hypothetical protein
MAIVLDGTSGITTPDLESLGPITGTTGTFSGAVQVSGVATNLYPLVSGTAVSASGTAVDFTGIPSWVKRITVMFSGVSTNGTSNYQIQIGAGSVTTSGYLSNTNYVNNSANSCTGTSATSGFLLVHDIGAASTYTGVSTLSLLTNNTWLSSGNGLKTGSPQAGVFNSGSIALGGTLDRIRITTVNGTDAFDAGTINIMYE